MNIQAQNAQPRGAPRPVTGAFDMPIALWALAAGAFGIGTTEFVIMGLLPEVGADLGQQPHDDELG
ncbi:hypothetical protein OMF39_10955, partial [Bordetella pertussis]